MHLPLNALRAFEAAARLLNLTHAAQELHVTQTSVSQHIRKLEGRLNKKLFKRLPRGLALTDEGRALYPSVQEAFHQLEVALTNVSLSRPREILSLACVGTFAIGWLLPRLHAYEHAYPFVDLRWQTNNNRVDLASEGLDFAIRFGDGAWHGCEAMHLMEAPLSPVCAPSLAAKIQGPDDLLRLPLLRSYRTDEWRAWFDCASVPCPVLHGAMFDTSLALAQAAIQGAGVALLPVDLFAKEIETRRLVQPFSLSVSVGAYWLTWLKSRTPSQIMLTWIDWMRAQLKEQD